MLGFAREGEIAAVRAGLLELDSSDWQVFLDIGEKNQRAIGRFSRIHILTADFHNYTLAREADSLLCFA